jgi:polar amino acid transport system permease protein
MYEFDWDAVWPQLPYLLNGVPVTLQIAGTASVLGLIVGLIVGLGRISKSTPLRIALIGYIELFRNTPVLVQIIWFFYALPVIAGITLSAYMAGVIALGLNASAYLAEVFRAGIQGLPAGQAEAARSLGMTHFQTLRRIVLPQAIRKMIPPFVNTFVVLIKGTSLVAFIGVLEVLQRGNLSVVVTNRPVEIYTTVAAIYLVVIFAGSAAANYVERRFRVAD